MTTPASSTSLDHNSLPLKGLFVSHDATLTGAPIMTSRLLRWLVEGGLVTPTLIAGRGGPLLPTLRTLATVIDAEPSVGPSVINRSRVMRHARRAIDLRSASMAVRRRGPFEVVYSSTLTTGRLLRQLVPAEVPVLSRVSELGHWLHTRVDSDDLQYSLKRTSHFICVSNAVARNLEERHGVAPERMTVLPGFVDRVAHSSDLAGLRQAARERLQLSAEEFVVGGIGTTDWRKGPDLFVQVAAMCQRDRPAPTFVWIGGNGGEERARLEHDMIRAGASVRFIDERPDAPLMASAFDLLCVPSREDPYPIVMMECGAVGVPMLCFSGSGGAEEFAERGGGVTVPYLDVPAMAAAIRRLVTDGKELRELGRTAHHLVSSSHTVDSVAPQIHGLLVAVASTAQGSLGREPVEHK